MGQRAGEIDHRPLEIEANIEQTRAEMSETIDAIQEKLSPAHIKAQVKEQVQESFQEAKDSVREATVDSVKGAGSTMWETIKQNPIPATIAGLSVAWLMRKGSSSSSSPASQTRDVRYAPVQRYPGYEPSGSSGDGMQERAGQMASQARNKVQEMGSQAMDQVSHRSDQAEQQAREAADWMQQQLHTNPLAVGAVALAVGSAVGLSLPETQMEDQLMGEARDSLMHKAQGTAKDTMHKVQHVAEEAQSTAKQEAEKQGLMD